MRILGLSELGLAVAMGIKPPDAVEETPAQHTDQPYTPPEYASRVLFQPDHNQNFIPHMVLGLEEPRIALAGINRGTR